MIANLHKQQIPPLRCGRDDTSYANLDLLLAG